MNAKLNFCSHSLHTLPFKTTHSEPVLSYILRLQTAGDCVAIHNGKVIDVKAGTFLLVKPGEPFEIVVDNPNNPEKIHCEEYQLVCEGEWIENWAEEKICQQRFHIEDFEKIVNIWKMLIVEDRQLSEDNDKSLPNCLLQVICLLIEQSANGHGTHKSYPFVVRKMMRYIEDHATTSLKVDDVASHVELSVSRSSFLFKSHIGKSMMEYALDVRLNIAIGKMKFTSETLEQIAEDSGFNTYNYFHKVFRKKYNKSPGDYRRREKDFYHLLWFTFKRRLINFFFIKSYDYATEFYT